MDLVNPEKSIFNNRNWGPMFGGNDVCITDKCNLNKESCANFPHSYNFTSKPYTKNQ